MNTYILVEPKRKELMTAINNVETFYDLCTKNNCFSDDLKLKTIIVGWEIERVMTLMDIKCYTIKNVTYRKLVYDTFLKDAEQLLREMSIAVSKCF